MYYSWKVARRLRDTHLFPIAFAIVWYVFMVLYVFTYAGLMAYQNYVSNAYLWLLIGILFRLPDLLVNAPVPVVVSPRQPRTCGDDSSSEDKVLTAHAASSAS